MSKPILSLKAKMAPKGNKNAVGNKGGNPGKYKKRVDLKRVKDLMSLGLTDKQLAGVLKVSEQTVNAWKKKPEFLEALRAGKDFADDQVERALFERATGYEHPEDDIRVCDGIIVTTPTVKHYPPDTSAAIIWLKNRRPEKWRDKPTGDGDGEIKVNITVSNGQAIV